MSLKNWVTRKLRSVYPELEIEENNLFLQALKDGPGPNLEFLGDVIKLNNGYYLPSPTRVIQIEDDKFILISGLPTKFFINAGLDVEISGTSRCLYNLSVSELKKINIPIQSVKSYIGLRELYNTNSFLEYILNHEEHTKWAPEKGMEAYTGELRGKIYGYDYWGINPLECIHPLGLLSLWRFKREWDRFEYRLLIKKPNQQSTSLNQKMSSLINYNHFSILLPSTLYKKICLALDMLSNNKRIAHLIKSNENVIVNINFGPPEELMRYIYAIGGKWQGYEKSYLKWIIPYHGIKTLDEIFNYLSVKIEWQ